MEERLPAQSLANVQVHDEQILSQVERALLISGYIVTLSEIRVDVHAGCVVLSGRLSTYYLKQVAQTAAMKVGGVVQLRNEIQVG